MERIFIVMTLIAGNPTIHAVGPFTTHANCERWAAMYNLSATEAWLGLCLPESEARGIRGVVFERDT